MSNTQLNEALKALVNPVRRDILMWLKEPKKYFHQPDADADEVGVCVSIIQEKVGLSQSTVSLYLSSLQRANLVTSKRIGPWTYYKRNNEKVAEFLRLLEDTI